MKLTGRDQKIAIVIAVLAVFGSYWFLLLTPEREEAGKTEMQLSEAQGKLDTATSEVTRLQGQRASFTSDTAEVVKLGKAIPSELDMPSLLVQLQAAAKGTDTDFESIQVADSGPGAAPASASPSGGQTAAAPSGNAAPGGAKAVTGPGKATEAAGNKVNDANAQSEKQSNVSPGDGQTSQGAKPGGLPVGGAAGAPGAGAAGAQAPGLTSVPLELAFDGSFFKLADFFHRLKRFVYVANKRIRVQGRLITLDSLNFTTDTFPKITVTVGATAYLTPKGQDLTAGATPSGPGPPNSAPVSAGPPSKAPTTPPAAAGTP